MIRNRTAGSNNRRKRMACLFTTGDICGGISVFICERCREGNIGARCFARLDGEYAEAGWSLAIE
jgi:hypothetical protein